MPSFDAVTPEPPPVVFVIDIANVMGSRPDGWWRDRAAAATRLMEELVPRLGSVVTTSDGVQLKGDRIVAVLEGRARDAHVPDGIEAVRATADGDSAVVAIAADLLADGRLVLVVTSDRGLRARLPARVLVAGPRWLLR